MADATTQTSNVGPVLKAIVERIEHLDGEIKGLNEDKRDIYAEAKGNGFDVKALREILKIRRQDPAAIAEQDAVVELYMSALGML